LRGQEVVYQNAAVAALLSELPLSMVISALDESCQGDFALSINLFGHSLELIGQSLGELTLLRLHPAEDRALIYPALVAELRDLLSSQQFTTERLLGTLSEQDNDLYGSSIRRCNFALLNFTERLGDMSQLAQGSMVILPQLIDLSQLYRDLIYALSLVLPKKYPAPSLSAEEPCYVNADPKRMEELLLYLLNNALRHTDGGGSVRVRLRNERGSVQLRVEDSGSGMDSGTISALFDPTATPWQNGHMSMGLSLAKGIAAAHGGSLLIRSRQGEGTGVLISLPAAENPTLPVGECLPPEGMRIIQRTMVDILGLDAYREIFDD